MRILRTVRRWSVEETRHVLGACLIAEQQATNKIQAIDDKAKEDRAAHLMLEEAFRFVEIFGRRLDASEAERRAAEAALATASAATAEARAALVAARTAAEAVDTLIAERTVADNVAESRREQHALDDMTRTRRNSNHPPAASRAR